VRRDAWRRHRIEVDGVRAGTIGPGEELVIPVGAGEHVIQARIDWSGSPRLAMVLGERQIIRMEVTPAGNRWSAVFRAFSRTGWLKLEPR
jgi:hypothetical protein